MTGRELGPYRVLEKLAQGGMGEVYRARDERLGRDVAVKLLPQEFLADPDRLRRFEQEARAAAALNHPNILSVHDIGTQDGVPYFVCELLKGETLRARLGRGPLTLKQVADYGAQLARGLAVAHEHGIVHRDIKPENLFITADGRLKILDFGIAKATPVNASADGPTATAVLLTEPGAIVGTVPYMSPEQVRGAPTDHRSDIFAAGAVLFEMLTGRRAFDAPSATEIMSAVLTRDPFTDAEIADLVSRSILPPALVHIIKHCLEKDPRARFQSARDIAFGLDVLSGASDPWPPGPDSDTAALPPAVRGRWRRGARSLSLLLAFSLDDARAWRPAAMTNGGNVDRHPAARESRRQSADDYFADGMTDSLITDLARTPNLAVIARAAVFRYKGSRSTRRKLVRSSARGTSCTAACNASASTFGSTFASSTSPLVSTSLASRSRAKSRTSSCCRTGSQAASSTRCSSNSHPMSRAARSRVRPLMNKRTTPTCGASPTFIASSRGTALRPRANLTRAIGFLEQAVSADPHFALAQAGWAAHTRTRFFYYDPDRTWERQAFLAIERALAVDPDLAEAYLARGQNAWSLPNNFPHEKP